jgi:hypothetical protein
MWALFSFTEASSLRNYKRALFSPIYVEGPFFLIEGPSPFNHRSFFLYCRRSLNVQDLFFHCSLCKVPVHDCRGSCMSSLFFAGFFSTRRDLVFCLVWTGALWSLSPSQAGSLYSSQNVQGGSNIFQR